MIATPDQELLRKLSYLARQDNDSVLTGALRSTQNLAHSPRKAKADGFADFATFLSAEEQRRQQQMQQLGQRLDALDRASLEALREAEERLEQVRRNAIRTTDGRLVFEDENGMFRDEQGNAVAAEQIDGTTRTADASSWREFRDAQRGMDEAAAFHQRVEEQRARLGADPDSDERAAIAREIDELEQNMPASVARAYRPPAPGAFSPTEETASARSTSAAKSYDAARPEGPGVQKPFARAVTPERSAFEAALEALGDGDTLVICKLDRAFRCPLDALHVLEQVERRGAKIRSLTESIDTATSMGRFAYQITNAFGEFERAQICERTKAGMAAAWRRSVRLGRPPNFRKCRSMRRAPRSPPDARSLTSPPITALPCAPCPAPWPAAMTS